jgi:galactose mutarotase-like enzyme
LVTGFASRGRELLYLDEATLADPTANVRGGVPILFPSPGKLDRDTFARNGKSGQMKQHGFARNGVWEVIEKSERQATLRLVSNDETRARYPWEFGFDLRYSLEGSSLRFDLEITNRDETPMPFGTGFHPYFRIAEADKPKARIPTRATRAFDNRLHVDVPVTPIDLARPEVDLHLWDHHEDALTLEDGPRRIIVRGSAEYTHWVIWTLEKRDFVCLEPWSCPGNALNTGDRLLSVAPGETARSWIVIECAA